MKHYNSKIATPDEEESKLQSGDATSSSRNIRDIYHDDQPLVKQEQVPLQRLQTPTSIIEESESTLIFRQNNHTKKFTSPINKPNSGASSVSSIKVIDLRNPQTRKLVMDSLN